MSVQVMLRDKFGKDVGRRTHDEDDVPTLMRDGVHFDRVGVEDATIIFVERCDTCGKAGHESDCYELQHLGKN